MNDLEQAMQRQMVPLSVRFGEAEVETLDRLVVAVRAYYESQAQAFPPAARLANEVTRSSALRDLLLAWKHGCVDQFSYKLTEKVK
jgi:hypothetical protein